MPRCCLAVLLLAVAISAWPGVVLAQTPLTPAAEPESSAAQSGPDYEALADILEDEAARNALVEELRRLAGEDVQAATPAEVSIARRIAATTRAIAEGTVEQINDVFSRLGALDFRQVSANGMVSLAQAVVDLAVVIAIVLAAVYVLRLAARALYRRASDWVLASNAIRPWIRRGLAALGCGLVDLAIVLVAWLIGYVVALALGEGGRMDTRQSLFLNAFLFIEAIKVVIRLFFATRYDGLRLLPITGEDAAYWHAWLSRLTSFVGYSMLLVVPVVSAALGRGPGQLLTFLVYATALVFAVLMVLQNREHVHRRLMRLSERSSFAFPRIAYGVLARIWHFIAIAYLLAFAVVSLFRPQDALPFIIGATLQSVLVIGGAGLVSYGVGRLIRLGVRLPVETRRRFPMLEARLNAFVPVTLRIVRVVIALVAAALLFDAWALFDFFDWVASETGSRFVGTVLTLAFVAVTAIVLWLAVTSWIEHRLAVEAGSVGRVPSPRERTLLTIFRNAFTIALVVMAVMIVLSEIGLDIGPLLAGAGVLGLAIGFGAQKLVQDVINGVFIQLENAMNTGDIVTLGAITGEVEKLTVRSVGIRDLSGTYHLMPFSSVDIVSNYMRGFGYHLGEYGVAYRENVDEVIETLSAAFDELRADPDQGFKIMDELEVHGLTEFADSSVVVRVRIKTLPGEQWGVGRAYNRLVKKHFDARGIEIPFPHVTLYFGEDKQGQAPAAPVRIAADGERPPATDRDEGSGEPPKQTGSSLPSSDDIGSSTDGPR